MIQVIIAVGFAWLLLRDKASSDDSDDEEDDGSGDGGSTWVDPNANPDGSCKEGHILNSSGVCVPFIPDVELDPTATWSIEYTVAGYTESVVWQLDVNDHRGIGDNTYIVIGNTSHTFFRRASVSGGTINIPAAVSGGAAKAENVIVYSDIASASARLDELANPEDDPTAPQPQPDDDDDDSGSDDGFGGLPPTQGYQLGQNGQFTQM